MSESDAVSVRAATMDDLDAVLELWRAAEAEPSISDDATSLRRLVDRDPEALLLAEHAGRVVGTVIATWDGWRGGIYRLAVRPDARRRGIASTLVAEAEARLVRAGAPKISALVLDAHDHAGAFWAAIGYQRDDRLTRWVRVAP